MHCKNDFRIIISQEKPELPEDKGMNKILVNACFKFGQIISRNVQPNA
ncbi:unnamed protein product [Moneuplotes crassus]|uniref:Uncharacterized protein n=1 Tax=Euplotes crassus TaxID=5936 RepID=A0AAD1XZI7_EUPCR|nr:unnamed protein product [Moneuplotes crassus]